MRRLDLILALTGATAAGVIAGYFLGQTASGTDALNPRPNASGQVAQAAEIALPADSELPPGATPEPVPPGGDWLRKQVGHFASATANQPTPGLAEAFRDATYSEPPFDQARMISLIDMLRKEDFPGVLQILRKAKTSYGVPGSTGQPMWLAFWRRFGELDPDRALAAAAASKEWNLPNQSETEKQVFNGMARNNPATAAATFLAHPELENRDSAVRGVMEVWMKKDPRAALAWTQGLEPELQADAYYAAGWGSTNRYDISAGTTLLKEVPTAEGRKSVERALKTMLNTRPHVPATQVLSLVETLRQVGSVDPNFEGNMASRIAREDPYAAANFFSQPVAASPDSAAPVPNYALRNVAAVWAQKDPKAAENWLKDREKSPEYPVFAAALAQAAQQRNDPAEAARWQAKLPPGTNLNAQDPNSAEYETLTELNEFSRARIKRLTIPAAP